MKQLNTIIALRRDILSNYDPTLVLRKGEVAYIDLPSGELKFKVGNGTTAFSDLDYADKQLEFEIQSIIVRGYFRNSDFYVHETGSEKYVGYTYKMYIDIPTRKVYSFNSSSYEELCVVNYATDAVAGISKLYNSLGANLDGSITQKCVTEIFNKKVEMELDDETLILTDKI